MTTMGKRVINPICSIATTVSRGSFASNMYIENRLGTAIAVLYRNGVNALLPPNLKGLSVNGTIEITVEYRCTGSALLNQYGNLVAKHPELVDVSDMPETSLKLKYVVTREDLTEKDVVYIDDLDLMLALNPVYGISEHPREGTSVGDSIMIKNLLENSYMHRILTPSEKYKTLFVLHYGDIIEVDCLIANVRVPTLETYKLTNGRVVLVRAAAIDADKVWASEDEAKRAVGVIEDTDYTAMLERVSKYYYDTLERNRALIAERDRDVAKELTTLDDVLTRERTRMQLEEISRIKHAQTVVSDGTKLVASLASLGVKVFG